MWMNGAISLHVAALLLCSTFLCSSHAVKLSRSSSRKLPVLSRKDELARGYRPRGYSELKIHSSQASDRSGIDGSKSSSSFVRHNELDTKGLYSEQKTGPKHSKKPRRLANAALYFRRNTLDSGNSFSGQGKKNVLKPAGNSSSKENLKYTADDKASRGSSKSLAAENKMGLKWRSFDTNKRKNKKAYYKDGNAKTLSKRKLKALHDALLVHPFKVWKFKDRFSSMADIGIHEALLHEVIDNKWNLRLEHKLYKALKGEDVHMAVIGGSNTAGGGILEDEGRVDRLFFRVISDWWRKTISPITGSRLKTRQIAMGGTASDFFQYCFRSYVQENVDLVLLEMSVNDLKQLPYNVNLSLPIEQLTRQLLEYPTEPALIYVNLLSGRAYYQGCTNLEDFGQKLLSDMYNITTFSWRDAVCPVIDGKYRAPLKGCSVVCKDGHHINQLGHAHISLMVINLFRDLLLDNIVHLDKISREIFHDPVVLPAPVFITETSKIVTEPLCWTTVTPNFKRQLIKNSMNVGVMENYGFDYLHHEHIGGHCLSENACRGDTYSGWTGQDVGAILTISFTVPPLGRKRRVKSRSAVFATRTCLKCGAAEVWLDDDYINRKFVQAKSQYSQTLLEIVAMRVNPGDHTMSVRLVEPGYLSVVGVMLGPPDGPY